MNLDSLDLIELRAGDGLATEAELAVLRTAGRDPDLWARVRPAVRAVLTPPEAAPDLVGTVMAALSLVDNSPPIAAAVRDNAGELDLVAVVLRGLDLSVPALGVAAAIQDEAGPVTELALAVLRSAHGALDVDIPVAQAIVAEAGPAQGLGEAVASSLDAGQGAAPLADAVRSGAGPGPELAARVGASLGHSDDVLATLLRGAMAHEAADVDLADAVLAQLGVEGAQAGFADALRTEAGTAPDLAASVMADLGLGADAAPVGDAIRGVAGPPPALAAGVLAALGLEDLSVPVRDALVDELDRAPTPVVPLHPPRATQPAPAAAPAAPARRFPLWAVPAVAMAAAALLMVASSVLQGESGSGAPVAPQVANAIEIEDVSTDMDAIVSVVQSEDEDATPIIFIDVLDDADTQADVEGEGTTL